MMSPKEKWREIVITAINSRVKIGKDAREAPEMLRMLKVHVPFARDVALRDPALLPTLADIEGLYRDLGRHSQIAGAAPLIG